MRKQIEKRIEELKRERDALIKNANAQIAAYSGAIAELERLLTPDESPTEGISEE